MQMQPYPSARYHQQMLANATKWLLTDASGVLNTRDDGSGYTDLVTTATAGTFYLTKPIADFLGGPLSAGSAILTGQMLVEAISGSADGDKYFVGWSDNADPTAGGALWSAGGLWNVTTSWGAMEADETTPAGSRSTSYALTKPHGLYPLDNIAGVDPRTSFGYVLDGSVMKDYRQNVLALRAFIPTHFVLGVYQAVAAIQTHRIGVGIQMYPSMDIEVTARS